MERGTGGVVTELMEDIIMLLITTQAFISYYIKEEERDVDIAGGGNGLKWRERGGWR